MGDLSEFLRSPEYAELLREHAEWRRKEAMQAVVALRRKHSDFMTRPLVHVVVPICDSCWSDEYHRFELPHRPPDITPDGWSTDLLIHGVTMEEIAAIEEGLEDRATDVSCHRSDCGQPLSYASDDIYVETEDFRDYFDELVPAEGDAQRRKARKWMKRLIYDAYGGHCFGCGTPVSWEERSTDHIQPFSGGGLSEPMNLQLLCRDCDERVKANRVPSEEHFTLHFPLVPVSDGFEGVVW